MAGKLEGKIALITGGNSGTGLATAKRFVQEGGFVYVTARRQAELDEAVKALGPQSRGIKTDASKLDELDVLFAQIKRSIGMNWTNVSKALSI